MSIIASQPLPQASLPYQSRLLLGNLKGVKARLRVGNLKGGNARLQVGNLKGHKESV